MGEGLQSKECIPSDIGQVLKVWGESNGEHGTRCTQQRRKQELSALVLRWAVEYSNKHREQITHYLVFWCCAIGLPLNTLNTLCPTFCYINWSGPMWLFNVPKVSLYRAFIAKFTPLLVFSSYTTKSPFVIH